MRNCAIDRITANSDDDTKEMIAKGVDDAIYGLMMVVDGVTGVLQNDKYTVSIKSIIK